ncbi:hypothetical protein [Saccharopolyspora hattusasensis]
MHGAHPHLVGLVAEQLHRPREALVRRAVPILVGPAILQGLPLLF